MEIVLVISNIISFAGYIIILWNFMPKKETKEEVSQCCSKCINTNPSDEAIMHNMFCFDKSCPCHSPKKEEKKHCIHCNPPATINGECFECSTKREECCGLCAMKKVCKLNPPCKCHVEDYISPTPTKDSWEKEFDKQFEIVTGVKSNPSFPCEGGYCDTSVAEVKSFIRSAIEKAYKEGQVASDGYDDMMDSAFKKGQEAESSRIRGLIEGKKVRYIHGMENDEITVNLINSQIDSILSALNQNQDE